MKAEETFFNIGRSAFVIIVSAAFLLLGVVLLVFVFKDHRLDEKIFAVLSDYITTNRTRLLKEISFWGNHRFLIPANLLLITFFLIQKNYWWAIRVTVVALSSLGIMSLLKNLIQRVRPPLPMVDGITNYGFPSGHAFMSIAFYGLLIVIAIQFITNKVQRRVIIALLLSLILLIGFSRIYLRVHYATDVVAGFCIGTIWLITVLTIMNKIQARFTVKKK